MIVADRDGDRIVFMAGPRYKEMMKLIPGVRYHAQSKNWYAPLSWSTCLSARGVLGELLGVGDELAAWSWTYKAHLDDVAAVKQFPAGLVNDSRLYPFQIPGAEFLLTAERAILADEMGTGKTVQTIAALREVRGQAAGNATCETTLAATGGHGPSGASFAALIVCTNSMKFTWAAEIAKWAPEIATAVIHGTAAKRRKQFTDAYDQADVVIVSWDTLRQHSRLAPYGSIRLTDKEKAPAELQGFDWDVVVFDEAHRMKDPKAKQTRAAWAVAHGARYRWALTGTPIANSPEDLWSIGHAVAPEDFPRRSSYVDRFCLSGMNVWGGLEVYGLDPKTAPELFGFLDPRFFRRTKAEVLQDLPPKTYSTRYVEMELKQRKSYDEFNKRMVAELDSGILLATDPLVKVGRLIQLAAATPELDPAGDVKALADPSCKVDALMDLLDEAPGEPVVVFAASRKLIELAARRLEKAKVSHVLITGAVEPAERSRNVEEFQDGKAQVCLATLGAGGEGITLTAASKVIFLQRSWSQVQNVQAEDRVHRISQVRPVEIIDVVSKDTIEDAVHASGALKLSRLQEIVRDPHWLQRNLKNRG